jgi:hypothetical protein
MATTLELENPEDLRIVVQRGSDLNLVMKFVAPLTGSTVKFTIRSLATNNYPVMLTHEVTSFTTDDLTDDTCAVVIDATTMGALESGEYAYSVQEQRSASQIATRLKGVFAVEDHAGVNI